MATSITWGKKQCEHVDAGDSCRRQVTEQDHIYASQKIVVGQEQVKGHQRWAERSRDRARTSESTAGNRRQGKRWLTGVKERWHIGQEPAPLLRLSVVSAVSATLNCVHRSLLVMPAIKRGARIKPLLSMEGQLSTHCTIAAVPYTNWVNILVLYSISPTSSRGKRLHH